MENTHSDFYQFIGFVYKALAFNNPKSGLRLLFQFNKVKLSTRP